MVREPVCPLGAARAMNFTVTSAVPPAGTLTGKLAGVMSWKGPVTDALVIERAVVPVLVKRTVAVSWEFHDADGPGLEPIRDITSRSLNGLPSRLRATKVSALALLTTTTVSFQSPLVLVGVP